MNSTYKGIMYCLIATLSWGAMFPIMSSALTYIDPFIFTALRYGIAAIAFIILLMFKEGAKSLLVHTSQLGLAWILGTLGFCGFGFLVFYGQSLAGQNGALVASIIMSTMPIMALFVVWLIHKLKPSTPTLIYAVLSFLGVFIVMSSGQSLVHLSSKASWVSSVLLFLGALCWVIYTMGVTIFQDWSPIRYTTITTILGMLSILVFDAILLSTGLIHFPLISNILQVAPHLLYTAIVGGFLAVLCWNFGNRILQPHNGVLFMNMVPITAFTISAMTGFIPTNFQILGVMVTVGSLLLQNFNYRRTLAKAS